MYDALMISYLKKTGLTNVVGRIVLLLIKFVPLGFLVVVCDG